MYTPAPAPAATVHHNRYTDSVAHMYSVYMNFVHMDLEKPMDSAHLEMYYAVLQLHMFLKQAEELVSIGRNRDCCFGEDEIGAFGRHRRRDGRAHCLLCRMCVVLVAF